MNDPETRKFFFCFSCRKQLPVAVKAINKNRVSSYCVECDARAIKNTGTSKDKQKKKYTEKQMDNMMNWINRRGG